MMPRIGVCQSVYRSYTGLVANLCRPLLDPLQEPVVDGELLINRKTIALRTALVAGSGFALWFTPLYVAARCARLLENKVLTPLTSRFLGSFAGSLTHKIAHFMTHRYLLGALSIAGALSWTIPFLKSLVAVSRAECAKLRRLENVRFLKTLLQKDNAPQELIAHLKVLDDFVAALHCLSYSPSVQTEVTACLTLLKAKQRDLIAFILAPGQTQDETAKKIALLNILAVNKWLQKEQVSEPDVCALFGCIQNDATGIALLHELFDVGAKNARGQTALDLALSEWLKGPSAEKMEKVCRLITLGATANLDQEMQVESASKTYAAWLALSSPTLLHTLRYRAAGPLPSAKPAFLLQELFPTKDAMITLIRSGTPPSKSTNLSGVQQTRQGLSLWEVILQEKDLPIKEWIAKACLEPLSPEERASYLPLTLASGRFECLKYFDDVEINWFECLTNFKNTVTANQFFSDHCTKTQDPAKQCLNKEGLSPLLYLVQKKMNDPVFAHFPKYDYIKWLLDRGLQTMPEGEAREELMGSLDKETDKDLIVHLNSK